LAGRSTKPPPDAILPTEGRRVRRTLIAASLPIAFIAFATSIAPARAQAWHTYRNDRYGTTVDYPDMFEPQPPPDADDGLAFKSKDGAELDVFASYNALDFDLAGFKAFTVKNLDPGKTVTYQAQGETWFVISGKGADGVFYERHMLTHGGQMTEGLVISYPAALAAKYNPLVARISKSFRPGAGFQTP
jgi:hypothetical protein